MNCGWFQRILITNIVCVSSINRCKWQKVSKLLFFISIAVNEEEEEKYERRNDIKQKMFWILSNCINCSIENVAFQLKQVFIVNWLLCHLFSFFFAFLFNEFFFKWYLIFLLRFSSASLILLSLFLYFVYQYNIKFVRRTMRTINLCSSFVIEGKENLVCQ